MTYPNNFQDPLTENQIRGWLEEDIQQGDITTEALIDRTQSACAELICKASGIIFGIEWMPRFIKQLGGDCQAKILYPSGSWVKKGELLACFTAPLALLLKAERSYLNIMQHLSGIATHTAQFVQAVSHTRAKIYDTRKTTPSLRLLEKGAVLSGGGNNHRIGLYDQFLIKENHLRGLRGYANPFSEAIHRARKYRPGVSLCIEVENLQELLLALPSQPEVILLDDMSLTDMQEAVNIIEKHNSPTELEASGGIVLDSVGSVAETGVHRISTGAITHSAPNLDISMLISFT